MPRATYLGELELIVLLTLDRIGADAYGMSVYDEIVTVTKRELAVPTVYVTLARLERKSFVKSTTGNASSERGGRAKKYYQLTEAGRNSLKRSRSMLEKLFLPRETSMEHGS